MPSLDDCPQTTPLTPSRVAGLPRNRWLLCVGITGWFQSECQAALRRNAHNGAAPLISSKTYLSAAASILAVEAYHAGAIRTLLLELGQADVTNKISALRASASNAQDDQGVTLNQKVNIFPVDGNALAFSRTTTQVLNVVYLGGAANGYGFFPNRLNGNIA
jgi:hypothetical protein